MSTSALPITCTLGADDYRERMAWIAELNRTALRHHTQDGLRLVLTYAPDAGERVRELVRRERDCCAFLTFSVQEDTDAVWLTVEAPAEAGASAAVLFEPFTAPETAAAPATTGVACDVACGCSGTSSGALAPTSKHRAAGVAAASGATAALACGVCCVLPFALPAALVANVGGALATFSGLYKGATWLAMAAVAGGWGWVAWQSARTGKRPARATLYSVATATVVLAIAYGWRFAEPRIIAALKA